MRSTVSSAARVRAMAIVRPVGRETDQLVGSVLVDIAYVLWPTDTAPNLATRSGCTVRAAERYLGGQRDWSGDAVAGVVTEILSRHAMRGLKVSARR